MNKDEKEILDGVTEWAKAMVSNDADAIGGFMHDDWVIVSERGVATKEYFLSFVRSGALVHTSFDIIDEPRIKIYGDTAIMTSRVTNTCFFNGEQMEADEFTTDVMIRDRGRWLGVHSHITSANKEFLEMIAKKRGEG